METALSSSSCSSSSVAAPAVNPFNKIVKATAAAYDNSKTPTPLKVKPAVPVQHPSAISTAHKNSSLHTSGRASSVHQSRPSSVFQLGSARPAGCHSASNGNSNVIKSRTVMSFVGGSGTSAKSGGSNSHRATMGGGIGISGSVGRGTSLAGFIAKENMPTHSNSSNSSNNNSNVVSFLKSSSSNIDLQKNKVQPLSGK
jgi:hypothetical protein